MPMDEVHRAIEAAARDSYGRLVAYLSARTRDVAAAEDALGDAFLAALDTWPRDAIPEKPEAWRLTAARRRLIDRARHDRRVRTASASALEVVAETSDAAASADEFPDERLKLLFVCAHPAIDPAVHTPLMLQTVLGLDAARIARAFLVSPAAMGQRLVRAKAKIRDACIAFDVPGEGELGPRLSAVLEAIYAAYASGWDDAAGGPAAEDAQQADVWLGDSLGEMALYFSMSDVALLGGSFAPLGGQNLIEAAACGCPVVMGPHTFNFTEAAELAVEEGAARRVVDMEQGVRAARKLMDKPEARAAAVAAGLAFADRNRGATARTVNALEGFLKAPAR